MANEKRLADLVKEAMAEALKVYDADDHEELAEWIANWLELNWVTIQKNPTVDAVEVVRCKDCQRWKYDARRMAGLCKRHISYTAEWDFCNYGESTHWMPFPEPPKEDAE